MHTYRGGGKPDAIVKDMIAVNEAYGLDLMGISEHIDRLDEREEFKVKAAANRKEAAAVSTKMRVMIGTESTMINSKSAKATGSSIKAWVPMTSLMDPSARPWRISRFSASGVAPIINRICSSLSAGRALCNAPGLVLSSVLRLPPASSLSALR